MKRFFAGIVFVLLASAGFVAEAQWYYGLRLGGAFTEPTCSSDDGAPSADGGHGFSGGLTLEWQQLSTGWAVGASLLYERRNISMTPAANPAIPDITTKLGGDYLSLPIDLKYKFSVSATNNLFMPYVFTGPDFAVRLNKAESKRFDLGWNVGLGFDIVNFIQISAGYRFGINDISPAGAGVRDWGAFVSGALLFSF